MERPRAEPGEPERDSEEEDREVEEVLETKTAEDRPVEVEARLHPGSVGT